VSRDVIASPHFSLPFFAGIRIAETGVLQEKCPARLPSRALSTYRSFVKSHVGHSNHGMPSGTTSLYRKHRFPPEIITHAGWLYHRFSLSFREVEELLVERGVIVSHETVRQWCFKFGQAFAKKLRRLRGQPGDIWHLDQLFVRIRGGHSVLSQVVDGSAHRTTLPSVGHYCAT